MKKKLLIGTALSVFLLTFAMAGVMTSNNKEVKEASAYTASDLPTTIDLNDCDETEIRNYYKSLNSLETQDRQGTNLLKNLKTILKNGQKYYSYESGTNIWRMYEITDRDWEMSPASSTTYGTYDSKTNKITGYRYGDSNTTSRNNPYLHAFYVNRDVTNQVRAWGNHEQNQWGINREHLWAKAEGFDSSGAGGARGDPFHLVAGNGYVNNQHSNYYYGYVDTSKSYSDCGNHNSWTNLSGNLTGFSLNTPVNSNNTVFEPQDSDKGDIARSIFYMVARYNYLGGGDTISSDNPNLEITDDLTKWESSGYTSTTSKTGKMGLLRDLLAWHKADPVDEYEIHRNNLLYKNFTNNRNPFIDFPEWVDYIWGTVDYNGRNYVSSSSTPTGAATPSSDTLNGYNPEGGEDTPAVKSVQVSPSVVSFDLDSENLTKQLTATVNVVNGAPTTVTWSSDDISVATISSTGLVAAVGVGTTTIKATSTFNTNKYATCTVTCSKSTPSGSKTAQQIYDSSDWVKVGTSIYTVKDSTDVAAIKFDDPKSNVDDYIYNDKLFAGDVSKNMTSLTVTINGKINGTDNSNNMYTVSALDSELNVLNSASYTGLIGNSYTDKEFAINSSLSGCVGFKVTYKKTSANWGVANISWEATYTASPTSISATIGDKVFHVGDTITKSDITVKDDLNNTITDFEFVDYTFQYSDIEAGNEVGEKEFEITSESLQLTTDLIVEVYKVESSIVSDTLTQMEGITGNSYTDFSNKTYNSSAVYAGQCAGSYNAIQLRSKNNNSGIIATTSGGKATSVSVVWNDNTAAGRTLQIYGKDTAYSSASDLYNENTQGTLLGTIVKGTSTTLVGLEHYDYIGLRSKSDAMYLTSITITYNETAENLSRYVMYSNTEGQCLTKFETASTIFEHLTAGETGERSTFMTSNDALISAGRERLEAWAVHLGKIIEFKDNDYVITNGRFVTINLYKGESSTNSISMFSVLLGVTSILAISSYLIIRKKSKEQ